MSMRGTLTWTFVAIIGVVALLISPVIVQEARFESHRSEMADVIDSAAPAERALPPSVRDLLLFSLGGHTAPYAARLLLQRFDGQSHRSAASWNVVYASWSLLVALHFSEQDRLTLIAHLAPTGGGHYGLDNTAQALFSHPLSEVSLKDAGTLVVLVKAPFLYDKPDRLTAERDQFLSRYQKG